VYDWFVLQKCEYMYFTGIKPEVPLATRILDLTDKVVNVFLYLFLILKLYMFYRLFKFINCHERLIFNFIIGTIV